MKFLVIFKQGVQYFHFDLGPTNSIALAHHQCQLSSLLSFSYHEILGEFSGLRQDSEADVWGGREKKEWGVERGVSLVHKVLVSTISCQQGRVRTQAAKEDLVYLIWGYSTFEFG